MSSFHDIVFSLRPKNQKTKSTTYWVAVLKPAVQPIYREEDFLWIKCHGSIFVKTIYEQYIAKHPEDGEIKLKMENKVPSDTTPMRDLDKFNDRLIVFEPFKGSDPSVQTSIERVPLEPIKHQVTVKPDPDELSLQIPPGIPKHQITTPAPQDENIRSTPISSHRPLPAVVSQLYPYQSATCQLAHKMPYSELSHALPPAPRSTAAHLTPKTPLASINSIPVVSDASSLVAPPKFSPYITSATPEWAISQGFEIFADRHQEKYEFRDPSLDASKLPLRNCIIGLYSNTMFIVQIRNHLYQEWLHLAPMQRQTYENYAKNNPQSRNLSVKFEPIKANLNIKDVLPVGDPGQDSQQKMDFQLQSLLKDATPEQMEASVVQGLKLLDQLKAPMSDEATSGSDAAQWVQQIGILSILSSPVKFANFCDR